MTLLDSDSNVTIFNNKKLVNNMHPSKQCIKIETNGDVRIESILSCAVPNITYKGQHKKDSMINIISIVDMANDYKVTIYTSKDRSMFVHLPEKIVRFR